MSADILYSGDTCPRCYAFLTLRGDNRHARACVKCGYRRPSPLRTAARLGVISVIHSPDDAYVSNMLDFLTGRIVVGSVHIDEGAPFGATMWASRRGVNLKRSWLNEDSFVQRISHLVSFGRTGLAELAWTYGKEVRVVSPESRTAAPQRALLRA